MRLKQGTLRTCPTPTLRVMNGGPVVGVCGQQIQATCHEETYFNVEEDGTLSEALENAPAEWTFYCSEDHDLTGVLTYNDIEAEADDAEA